MKIHKALKRDKKIQRRKSGHTMDNRSIFLLEEEKKKRALQIRKEREEKENLFLILESD